MNSTSTALLALVAGVAILILVLIGATLAYDAMADDDMMGDMWGMMGGRSGRSNGTRGTASGQGEVRIIDFLYEPSVLEVTPGTVVKWTNEDAAPHTATTNDERFDTGRLDKGESADVTFETPGTYNYICTYHPSMEGRVVVSGSPR